MRRISQIVAARNHQQQKEASYQADLQVAILRTPSQIAFSAASIVNTELRRIDIVVWEQKNVRQDAHG